MWESDQKGSWMLKNWCFWTVALEKTPESPLTARRLNQSILKEINPEYSLEGLMLKLKLQYFGPLVERADSLKRPWCWERLGKGEGDNRWWDDWMASLTQWTWVWVNSGSWWWTGRPGVLLSMGWQWLRHDWVTELNWLSVGYFRFSFEPLFSFYFTDFLSFVQMYICSEKSKFMLFLSSIPLPSYDDFV